MNIKEIFAKCGSDKTTSHAYHNIYEFIIPYVKSLSGKCVLEIGYETGAGTDGFKLMMPNKNYYAIDIKFLKKDDTVRQIFCDTGDEKQIVETAFALQSNEFSLIVDDGSHILMHQAQCLIHFWDLLQPGGIYLIEDIYNLDHAYSFRSWPGFCVVDTRPIAQTNDICVILRKPV